MRDKKKSALFFWNIQLILEKHCKVLQKVQMCFLSEQPQSPETPNKLITSTLIKDRSISQCVKPKTNKNCIKVNKRDVFASIALISQVNKADLIFSGWKETQQKTALYQYDYYY